MASVLIEVVKRLLTFARATASNGSVAVAGDNNAPITIQINAQLSDEAEGKVVEQITSALITQSGQPFAQQLPSDLTVKADAEKHLDDQIDSIRDWINEKPVVALKLLEKLYASVAATCSGRVRFRIKANIGICHHLLGDDHTAARYLREAYADAPLEPKAIANNVLGLLLQGDAVAAFRFASEQIKLYPDNEALAGYMVQSAAYVEVISTPLDLVSIDIQAHPDVIIGNIHFLQKRRQDEEWWKVAHEGSALHPDNDVLRYYAAEATLAEIAQDPELDTANTISADKRDRLRAAAAVIEKQWEKALKNEADNLHPYQASTCHNLLTAYFILHDFKAIRQVYTAALADQRYPTVVLEHIGKLALMMGDKETTKIVLDRCEDSATMTFLRFNLAVMEHDWNAIASTSEETISHFPAYEKEWSRVFTRISAIESRGTGFTEDDLLDLIPLACESIRAHVILAKTARKHGLDTVSVNEYEQACSLVTPESNFAGRVMAAEEGATRGNWEQVIALLAGHVSITEESEELRMLGLAFANFMPPLEQGIEFFDSLPHAISNKPRFAMLAGTLHYNHGDIARAEECFSRAHAADPHSLEAVLSLAQTFLRGDKPNLATDLLARVNPSEVNGKPIEKMHLAQLMAAHGRAQDALAFGYRTLCSEPNDSKINLAYVGLLLATDPTVIYIVDTVQPGCWFRLENQHSESFSAIIDDGSPDYRQQLIPADHPLASGAMGRKVGEIFEVERGVGPAIQWTIREVLDKRVFAFQDTMGKFEHRFPNQPGIYKFSVAKDDISVLLDSVKDQSERQRKGLDFYVEKHWPLAVAASALNVDVITMASRVREIGCPIISNSGQLSDLELDIRKLEAGKFCFVVLDTYTAWTAVCGDLLPSLKRIFPRLIVARSSIDELQQIHAEFNKDFSQESMALSWRDGQFYREVFTPEQMQEQARLIRARIDAICVHCEVQPVVWKEPPSETAKRIIDAVESPHVWDAAYLASSTQALLLSEDMFYRQWAWAAFPSLHHSWLQAVFGYAVKANRVSQSEYAQGILSLASSKHSYISVNPQTLFHIFLDDQTETLHDFSTIAECIGGKNPDWPSHVQCTVGFLNLLWSNAPVIDLRVVKATGIMLTNLLRHSEERWSAIFAVLLMLSDSQRLQYEMNMWRQGHFLPDEEIKRIIKSLSRT